MEEKVRRGGTALCFQGPGAGGRGKGRPLYGRSRFGTAPGLADPRNEKAPGEGGFFCGASRDRTDDLLNAIQALSQLSYDPITATSGRVLTASLLRSPASP